MNDRLTKGEGDQSRGRRKRGRRKTEAPTELETVKRVTEREIVIGRKREKQTDRYMYMDR